MDDELTAHQRDALATLGADLTVPDHLEQAVVNSLRQQGMLGASRRWVLPLQILAGAAAAMLVFALGVMYASSAPEKTSSTGDVQRQFVLLLLEPMSEPLDAAEEAARVIEYGNWAGRLAAEGRLLAGEKLEDAIAIVGGREQAPNRAPEERVTGFFIVRAASLDDALVVARDCPHARHGNRIEVRAIDPT